MTNLLVELQTEELPPKALDTLSKAFGNEIAKSLAAQHLTEAGSVATCYGTPRRLAVHITNVLDHSADEPFSKKLMPKAIGLDAEGKPAAPLSALALTPSSSRRLKAARTSSTLKTRSPASRLRKAFRLPLKTPPRSSRSRA